MLGYTKEQLDTMIKTISLAYDAVPDSDIVPPTFFEDLNMVSDFLQGLWAEGYFD